jgi:PIN domain nuclease of toxin-antitoxin system
VRLILDSQILIAIALDRLDKVCPNFARVIGRPEMDLTASVASLWEIAIKSRLGKLDAGIPVEVLPDFFMASGIAILPITAPHAVARINPLPPTRDPFDRLLLAQCSIEGRRLVTVDAALRDHPLAAGFDKR